MICPHHKIFSGDKMMGGTCSAYRGEEYIGFWWGNLWERGHLEVRGLGGKIILRWIFRKCDVGVRIGSS